jgi:hypothetical protein
VAANHVIEIVAKVEKQIKIERIDEQLKMSRSFSFEKTANDHKQWKMIKIDTINNKCNSLIAMAPIEVHLESKMKINVALKTKPIEFLQLESNVLNPLDNKSGKCSRKSLIPRPASQNSKFTQPIYKQNDHPELYSITKSRREQHRENALLVTKIFSLFAEIGKLKDSVKSD